MLQVFLFIALFITLITTVSAKISNYRPMSMYVTYKNKEFLLIRSYSHLGIKKYLALNTTTFNTQIIDATELSGFSIIIPNKQHKLYNHNLESGYIPGEIYLSVDMCPSHKKGFEQEFFLSLINYAKATKKEIYLFIPISALWAINHPIEFAQIKEWATEGSLKITWGNHTYNHFYDPKLLNDKNFMIHDKINAKADILNNEIFMLENGLTPSIFFRFPGLVYDKDLIKIVRKLNLISLGSNAWLAKANNNFSDMSIILVHGNKNEPLGIKLFLENLKQGKFNKFVFADIRNILK